jgi:hypothetical protein
MAKFERENETYTAWIKIDDSLPWIELKETFQTKSEAQESVREKLCAVRTKIVKMSQPKIQRKVQ